MGRIPAIGSLEKVERQRHRAHQPAVDINRAAAHALHDAGFRQRTAGKPRQNNGLPGPDIFQNAQDIHLEFLDFVALEDSFADGVLAGAHISQRVDCHLRGGELRPHTRLRKLVRRKNAKRPLFHSSVPDE